MLTPVRVCCRFSVHCVQAAKHAGCDFDCNTFVVAKRRFVWRGSSAFLALWGQFLFCCKSDGGAVELFVNNFACYPTMSCLQTFSKWPFDFKFGMHCPCCYLHALGKLMRVRGFQAVLPITRTCTVEETTLTKWHLTLCPGCQDLQQRVPQNESYYTTCYTRPVASYQPCWLR